MFIIQNVKLWGKRDHSGNPWEYNASASATAATEKAEKQAAGICQGTKLHTEILSYEGFLLTQTNHKLLHCMCDYNKRYDSHSISR